MSKVDLSYWLTNGKQRKLSYIMHQCLLKLHEGNSFRSSWLMYIKSLLDHSGMSGVWHEQNGSNHALVKLTFERNVKDQ